MASVKPSGFDAGPFLSLRLASGWFERIIGSKALKTTLFDI